MDSPPYNSINLGLQLKYTPRFMECQYDLYDLFQFSWNIILLFHYFCYNLNYREVKNMFGEKLKKQESKRDISNLN